MLDQSFSAENFRRILDKENRKGMYLEKLFFPNICRIVDEIKQCNRDIKEQRRSKKIDKDGLIKLYDKRRELKKIRKSSLSQNCKK